MRGPRSKFLIGIILFIVAILLLELVILAKPSSTNTAHVTTQGSLKVQDRTTLASYLKKIDFNQITAPVLLWDTDKTIRPARVNVMLTDEVQPFDKAITDYNGKPVTFHSFGQEYKEEALTLRIQFFKGLYPTKQEADRELNKYILRVFFLNNHPKFFSEPALQKELQNILDEYDKSPKSLFESNTHSLNFSFQQSLKQFGNLLIRPVHAGCVGTFECANNYTEYKCQGSSGICTESGKPCGQDTNGDGELDGTCAATLKCDTGGGIEKNCSFFGNQDTCTNDRGACSQNQCLGFKACSWTSPTNGPPPPGTTPTNTPTPPPIGGCDGISCGGACCHPPDECITTDGPPHCGRIVDCSCDVATCDYSNGTPGRCITKRKACKQGGCEFYENKNECYPDNGQVNPHFCPGAFEASSCTLSSPDAIFIEPVGTTVFTAYESENEIGGLIRCNKPTYTTQCEENNVDPFNQGECFDGNNCSGKVKVKSTGNCVMTVSCENNTIQCSDTTTIYNPRVRGRTLNANGTQLQEVKNISRVTCPSNLQNCSVLPSQNDTADETYSKGDLSSGYIGIKITTRTVGNVPLVIQNVEPSVANGIELPNCAGANSFCYLWPASSFGTRTNSPTATRTVSFWLGVKPTGAPLKGKVFLDVNNNSVKNGADSFIAQLTFLVDQMTTPFTEKLKDSTATGDADDANLNFGIVPNGPYSLSAALSDRVGGIDYSLLRCGSVQQPTTLPTPGNLFLCAKSNVTTQLKTWSTTCPDNLCDVTNDEVIVDGQPMIIHFPYVPSTPTPTPTQGPWAQLKNASYQTNGSLKQTIPAGAQAYDADAAPGPLNRFVLGQQGMLLGNITPAPESNGWFTSTYNPSIFFDTATFIQYARSRKNVKTITNLTQINQAGIYYYNGDVTLDDILSLPNGETALLLVNGTVRFGAVSQFNSNGATPARPRTTIGIMAKKIIFPDAMTQALGIFIADAVDLSETQSPTVNTPLKIYGNLISRTPAKNYRSQTATNNQKPSLFVVVDYGAYIKLLPYLSIASYDRKEVE